MERTMEAKKSEVLQGTLDLMILKTLHALGPLDGFGIARRIEQVSHDVLQLNEGTVYTSLLRLQQQGWIAAEWGTSEAARIGNGKLGADCRSDWACAATRGGKGILSAR